MEVQIPITRIISGAFGPFHSQATVLDGVLKEAGVRPNQVRHLGPRILLRASIALNQALGSMERCVDCDGLKASEAHNCIAATKPTMLLQKCYVEFAR